MNITNNTVYKCELLSVKPDITVNQDRSKKKNMQLAETMPVKSILVTPTWDSRFMREIITGIKIPVYRIQVIKSCNSRGDVYTDHLPPKKTIFYSIRRNN